MPLTLIRNVTVKECRWLERSFHKGEVVRPYRGVTYGVISGSGMACSMDGGEPFFELPLDALKSEDE